MDFVPPLGSTDEMLKRTALNRMKCREQIRTNIEAGSLPRDFDVTQVIVGHSPVRSTCAGCGETFPRDDPDAIAYTSVGQNYWFHKDCEKLWQEERHRSTLRR
jgi:hypothetical protein